MGSEKDSPPLPKVSESQQIGNDATTAFHAARPNTWLVKDLSGDSDFGLDALIQFVFESRVVGLCHAQIKGSRRERFVDGKGYAVSMKLSTLSYYEGIEGPIMLVFADLSVDEEPRNCPVYWTWITDATRKLFVKNRNELAERQQNTLTVYVPKENRLARDTDVMSDVVEFQRRASGYRGLLHAIETSDETRPPVSEVLDAISKRIEIQGKSLISSLMGAQDSPWNDPDPNSLSGILHEAYQCVRRNDDVKAEQLVGRIDGSTLKEASDVEAAEYQYLLGKIALVRGDNERAINHFGSAREQNKASAKYKLALFETQFGLAFPDHMDDVEDIYKSMQSDDDEQIICLRARIQAALGDFDGALNCLNGLDSSASLVAKSLILYLRNDWDAVVATCDAAMERGDLKDNEEILLHTLKARAYLYTGTPDLELDKDIIIPPFGTPGMDFERLRLAWCEVQNALDLMRRNNWPRSSEHILDVVGIVAIALGRQREVLNMLESLSEQRPNITAAHETLHRLASLSGEGELSLRALERMEENDDVIHYQIFSLYEQERFKEALQLAEAKLLNADLNHRLHGTCLGVAAHCAHKILDSDRAKPFEERLHKEPQFKGEVAVFEFLQKLNSNPLSEKEALTQLRKEFEENRDDENIQNNLLPALDVYDGDEASLCVEVSVEIRKRRQLALREVKAVAQSLITLKSWVEVIQLAEDAINQYGSIPVFLTIKAVAYEAQGQSAEAMQILKSIVDENPEDELAIKSYITICSRNGFHQEALSQLEALFQRADNKVEQLSYLQQMFGLEMSISPTSGRLLEFACTYGRLCDENDEQEEAIFLQMFMFATLSGQVASTGWKAEFDRRGKRFFETYPESRVLWSAELPEDKGPQAIKQLIDRMAGVTPEIERHFKRMENRLNQGEIVVPYVWRPRRMLRHIPDVIYLWEFAKTSSRDAIAFHLVISADPNYSGAELRRGLDQVPMLDITTLIVLHDLELLELAFEILPRVAIGKGTLNQIQLLSHPLFIRYPKLVEISAILRDHITQIDQPGIFEQDEDAPDHALAEIKSLVATGQYALYIDDFVARQYVQEDQDNIPSITTIDLMVEAERRGLLTAHQVSEKLGQLIEWKVVIPVASRYFLASVPKECEEIDDLDEMITSLSNSSAFSKLTNGLWDMKIKYTRVLDHFSGNLAYAAQNGASVILIAGIWAIWFAKVSLRRDVRVTDLEQLADSLISMAVLSRENPEAVKLLWDAYILLVERKHGPKMDVALENQARAIVGRRTAMLSGTLRPGDRDTIFEALTVGFQRGTAEYDSFSTTYETERVHAEQNRRP